MTSIVVRPEGPEDYPSIREALTLAFPDEDVARLTEVLRNEPGYTPELALVAIAEGEIVGHIFLSPVHVETSSGDVPALMLGPLGVVPAWQNQGIGTRLVWDGLDACRRLEHRILTVLGHPSYYPRFGFVLASAQGITMDYSGPDEGKMVMELAPGALDGVHGPLRWPAALDEV